MQIKIFAPQTVHEQWTHSAEALRSHWQRVVAWFVMEAPEEWAIHPDVLAQLQVRRDDY